MSTKKQLTRSEKSKSDRRTDKNPLFAFVQKHIVLIAILSSLASYYVFIHYEIKKFTATPKMPIVDLAKWWGPYPIDIKQDTSIKPYKIEFPDFIVNDLRERLLHRRPFTPPLEDAGFTYGFNTYFLIKVLDYWQNSYDFKEREQFLNKYDQYVTNIQGLDIHYMHVKPKPQPNVTVVPILIIHGWPGSIREFYELIPMLTTPRPTRDFVFEVIAPSIPGYGFSQAPVRSGMGPIEVSAIFYNLMKRIGHEKYYVHGGDYGHAIGSVMATIFPDNILGFHTNMPMVFCNPTVTFYTLLGAVWPRLMVDPALEDRMYPLSKHMGRILEETGYFHIQATKPDTVGAALTDSPAGLAAYILEKFSSWTNMEYRNANDGGLLNKFSLTHLLDNVMIYWTTNTITSSMRHYAEGYKQLMLTDQIPTEVLTWGIKFKHELLFQPDSILKLKYKKYLQSVMVEDGGHFPAMELPDILADDIFQAVHIFRYLHANMGAKTEEPERIINYEPPKTVYDFTVKDIKGRDVRLEKYRGYVLIIVNVASQCGYTNVHYTQLNELYEKYNERGLRILAFPCNQFGGQEPGTVFEILQFTEERKVKFDLFDKIDVNGDNAHPLWKFLKKSQGGTLGDFIKWNFSKFIVNKNGVPVERFGPNTSPKELEPYLDKLFG